MTIIFTEMMAIILGSTCILLKLIVKLSGLRPTYLYSHNKLFMGAFYRPHVYMINFHWMN